MVAPDQRRLYGVYRTPPALTGYVVRSVDLLLRAWLGRPAGLADRRVRVLDPAAGAMNFIRAAWQQAIRNHARTPRGSLEELIRCHLLPSFRGVELREEEHARGVAATRRFWRALGYVPHPSDPQPAVLADSLVPPPGFYDSPVNVVLGNPPWRGGINHRGHWIGNLLHGYELPDGSLDEGYFWVDGKPLGERNSKWLQDDCVRYLRLAQWLIDDYGEGVAGLVLNHNFIQAPTFRGVRRSLLRTFEQILVLDLHGNRRRQYSQDLNDDSVFAGVAQGAAILLLVKKAGIPRRVLSASLRGSRQEKLRFLARHDAGSTAWAEVEPKRPSYAFVAGDRQLLREYDRWPALPDIFPVFSSGIITGRDRLVTAFDPKALESYFAGLRRLPRGDVPKGFSREILTALRKDAHWQSRITDWLVRPFDVRSLFYADYLLARPRMVGMASLRGGDNLGLIATRQCHGEPGVFITRWITGHKVLSGYDPNVVFPLYLGEGPSRRPNLGQELADKLGRSYGEVPCPEDILAYVYGVLFNPIYRRRFRDLLRRGFPRIFFPTEEQPFSSVVRQGRELIGLHLLRDPRLDEATLVDGKPAPEPELLRYRIGDRPVLAQWLRTRKGRRLTVAERMELPRIIEAVRLTLQWQSRIEEGCYD